MIKTLEQYYYYSGPVLLFLPIIAWIIAVWKREDIRDSPIKWFVPLLAGIALLALLEQSFIFAIKQGYLRKEIYRPILDFFGTDNTSFINPIHYLIRFIFLGLFFRDVIKESFWKQFFKIIMWILILFELVQVFVFKSYQGYDSLSSTLKNLFIIGGFSLFLFQFYHSDTGKLSLVKNAYFWISLSWLIPALAQIFLEFIFNKLNQTDKVGFLQYYLLRNASQIIGFLLFIMGIWQAKYLRFLPKEY